MLKPKFREEKTTQAAAFFLKLAGGKLNYMKLIKLLYIIDRRSLISWGHPVTYDSYVSMKYGPVLSNTLDLINKQLPPNEFSYWKKYISPPKNYLVRLNENCPIDELSEAEIDLIRNVFSEFKDKNEWDMVKMVHSFEEWEDPQESAIPIEYKDILKKAAQKTPSQIKAIENELENLAFVDYFLSE